MIIVHNSGLTGDTNNATVSNLWSVLYETDSLSCFIMLLLQQVEIDRRMLDFCVGLDTEFSEVVEGSHLYFPKTKFEQVTTICTNDKHTDN